MTTTTAHQLAQYLADIDLTVIAIPGRTAVRDVLATIRADLAAGSDTDIIALALVLLADEVRRAQRRHAGAVAQARREHHLRHTTCLTCTHHAAPVQATALGAAA
jgi:hypothetical protein